jgi:hypothetical protein
MISPLERMRASRDRKSRKSVLLLPSYHTRKNRLWLQTLRGQQQMFLSLSLYPWATWDNSPDTAIKQPWETHERTTMTTTTMATTHEDKTQSLRKRIFEPRRSKGLQASKETSRTQTCEAALITLTAQQCTKCTVPDIKCLRTYMQCTQIQ